VHADAAHANKQQQAGVNPVTCRIPLLGLSSLVNPDADDLTRGAHRDVQSDGKADGAGGVEVGGEPAEERRDAGEGTAGGDDEATVSRLLEPVS
jgi:hypothetical protein